MIYGIEPHPIDEWWLGESRLLRTMHRAFDSETSITIKQPVTLTERNQVAANAHQELLHGKMILAVDTMDNHVFSLYAARPTRFYLIDEEGVVIFEQDFVPYILDPDALDEFMAEYFSN